jgi:hypothetical protein
MYTFVSRYRALQYGGYAFLLVLLVSVLMVLVGVDGVGL